MRKALIILGLFISLKAFSQKNCDCAGVFSFVAEQIETNSASFAHQVTEGKRNAAYNKHKKQVGKIAESLKTEKECLGIIQYYLSFLRDAHQQLVVTDAYHSSKTVDSVANATKPIADNAEKFELKNIEPKDILGDWHYKDGSFSIQIQHNREKGRKYVGILSADVKNKNQFPANKADLKIEFYKNYKGELYAVYWSFAQLPSSYKVVLKGDVLMLGRNLTFYRKLPEVRASNKFELPDSTYFETLDSNTNYLRINSFDYDNKKTIDSIIRSKHPELLSKKNLIIDVRNNGGGSDLSYSLILPYIMDSTKFQSPIAASSIWVSKDNLNDYDKERYLYGVETKEDSLQADKEIATLKRYIGKFEPYDKTSSKVDTIYSMPENVYIIQNRFDASSTEGFIMTGKQSGKVKTLGENTAGMVSYGEWRKLEIPDFPAWISMTQKKMIFYNDADFEMIGIEPDIPLNPDDEINWINISKREIEQ